MSASPASSAKASRWPSVLLAALLAGAGFAVYRAGWGGAAAGELGFFYDVSAARIFTGPRDAPPPIRGVDGPEEDGFRALVYSATGRPGDRSSWQVGYLEKFSPDLRQQVTDARARGEALAMGRAQMQAQRFVRRVTDTAWHPMISPEGEQIVTAWATPTGEGVTPVVCTP